MSIRLRLLPLVIFSATCLLSIKVIDLANGVLVRVPSVGIGESLAAGHASDPAGDPAAETDGTDNQADRAAGAAGLAEPQASAEQGDDADGGSVALPRSGVVLALGDDQQPYQTPPLPLGGGSVTPLECTIEELAVLEALGARRDVLDAREQEIEARERQLGVAEQRIDQRITELSDLQTAIQEQLDAYDAQEDEELLSLVKIYEAMKPKDAAPIFEQLDMDILLAIVSRMSGIRSAPILARMSPARAQEVTEELARRMQERPDFLAQPVAQ